jgi:hypothetical protein
VLDAAQALCTTLPAAGIPAFLLWLASLAARWSRRWDLLASGWAVADVAWSCWLPGRGGDYARASFL